MGEPVAYGFSDTIQGWHTIAIVAVKIKHANHYTIGKHLTE